jgi:hypothetical protein
VLSHATLEPPLSRGSATPASVLAREVQHGLDLAREQERLVLRPFLATNAEPEREWEAGRAAVLVPSDAGAKFRGDAGAKLGRGLLARANTALQQGHEELARDALQLYDAELPHNPFPALRAQVAAGLAARRAP